MIFRAASRFSSSSPLSSRPPPAQERVSVVTQRLAANGGLFIATVQGYFKAEGIELQLGAYGSAREVVEAVAAGSADLGLTEFTPTAFNLAGQGVIKAVAAQAREKRDYEGAELVASNAAYAKGLRKFDELPPARRWPSRRSEPRRIISWPRSRASNVSIRPRCP